jgi:predicted dehydrogenase
VAAGRKLTLAYEVTGTKGTLFLDFERMNELKIYTVGAPRGRDGFKTILAGPDHPFYRGFCPAAGHHIGFNDLKTIEVRGLIEGLIGAPAPAPDFREAWEIQRVVDAIVRSSRERRWVRIEEI